MAALTHSDVRKILELLDQTQQLDTLEIRMGDFVLQARKSGSNPALQFGGALTVATTGIVEAPPPTAQQISATPSASEVMEVPAGMVAVRSPMLGTFYRKPSPEKPAFVEEGSHVAAEDTVGLVEVMKLYNTVQSPIVGRVHRIVAEHGKLVQHSEILMLIDPQVQS